MSNGASTRIQCGTAIRRANGVVGTLGCLVESLKQPGKTYVLSNAHVLAFAGDMLPEKGDTIRHGQNSKTNVANLEDWSKLLKGNNLTDSAIAVISNPDDFDPAIADLGMPIHDPNVVPFPSMRVMLRGSGSQVVTGTVEDASRVYSQSFRIPEFGRRQISFVDQVLFEYDQRYENLLFGYSGSLVMDKNNHALGLFWAGSRTFGLFCKIQHVFDQYNVKLVVGS